jgi:hypothetical protein
MVVIIIIVLVIDISKIEILVILELLFLRFRWGQTQKYLFCLILYSIKNLSSIFLYSWVFEIIANLFGVSIHQRRQIMLTPLIKPPIFQKRKSYFALYILQYSSHILLSFFKFFFIISLNLFKSISHFNSKVFNNLLIFRKLIIPATKFLLFKSLINFILHLLFPVTNFNLRF